MTSLLRSPGAVMRAVRLRPTRAQLLAVAAWAAAAAVVGHLAVSAVSGRMLDLDVYRSGGQAILHGGRLYMIRAADRLPFTYPPPAALLAVPLALVPFTADKVIWIARMLGPLALAVGAGFRPALTRAGRAAPAVFAMLFAAAAYLQPVRQEIGFGQVDLLLLALCLTDCLAENPRWPRGLLIGIATAVKLEPGVFIIYLLITGRRRPAGTAALSFACATGLAWAVSPADSAAYWGHAILDTGRLGGNGSAGNQALRGMVLRALHFHQHVAPDLIWFPLVLLAAAGGFAAARACWLHSHEIAGLAITGLLGALLSPVGWIHHLCWVVVALGALVGDRAHRLLPTALTAALFATNLPTWVEHTQSAVQLASVPGFVLENCFGLAALALIPALWWWHGRPVRRTSATDDAGISGGADTAAARQPEARSQPSAVPELGLQ
jgi:alpha-1,2-mannosyltransferase